MINHNKLEINLEKLQRSLPQKPKRYTKTFPLTIGEGLFKYANQRTVNGLGIDVYHYNLHGWPVPLYIDNSHIKVGFVNNIFDRIQKANINRNYRKLYPHKRIKKVTIWNSKVHPWRAIG